MKIVCISFLVQKLGAYEDGNYCRKNDIADGMLEYILDTFSAVKVAVICNKTETGHGKNFCGYSTKKRCTEYRFGDAYMIGNAVSCLWNIHVI